MIKELQDKNYQNLAQFMGTTTPLHAGSGMSGTLSFYAR
jgi:hypothetical protein